MELFELLFALFFTMLFLMFLGFILPKFLKIYNEHERGVRFRLGRFDKVLGPGPAFSIPYLDSSVAVDTRSQVIELRSLKAITKEKATVFLGVAVHYHVSSPELAVTKVSDAQASLKSAVESIVRHSAGELSFGELVEKREFINAKLRESVSSQAEGWGLEIEEVAITDVTPSKRTAELMHPGNRKNK